MATWWNLVINHHVTAREVRFTIVDEEVELHVATMEKCRMMWFAVQLRRTGSFTVVDEEVERHVVTMAISRVLVINQICRNLIGLENCRIIN